jgi:exopolyphosphatase/pppGpp-phosphohydrolase
LQQAYATARQQLGSSTCLTVLHLGAQHSGFAVGTGPKAQTLHSFELGLVRLAERYFKTSPPTPMAMEHTIMVVEDVVMPLRAAIPREARLVSCDAVLRQVAWVSGAQAEGASASGDENAPLVLSLAAMEHTFNRLVHVVEGRPAAQEGLPSTNTFAIALLVLREFMHHLQFDTIHLLHDRPK